MPEEPEDQLLSQDDIESLLQQSAGQPSETQAPPEAPESSKPAEDSAAQDGSAEQLLDQVESDLAAAVSPEPPEPPPDSPTLDDARPFELQSFEGLPNTHETLQKPLDALQDVELDLQIELGRTELRIEEVLKLKEGSVVPLNKLAGDPVDILVNGRLIARGEVLVLNDNFCVRVAEILSPDD